MRAIESIAAQQGQGPAFVSAVVELADGESGACFGLPAHNFDARLASGYSAANAAARGLVPFPNGERRPNGKALITAWGCFQFNRDAWRALPGVHPMAFPWDCTPDEELRRPIEKYAQLWRRAVAAGLSAGRAHAMIRAWHAGPAYYSRVISAVEGGGSFAGAWAAHVPSTTARRIEKHVSDAGLGYV